jgi:myo-inositol-1(or 4)-monophosphatase
MARADATELYEACVSTAREAGVYLLQRFKAKDLSVMSQASHDVKLDVDVEAENLIKERLSGRFPGHGFICEESGRGAVMPDDNWVVDPLDGTVNFFAGIPHFCTSVAFKRGGRYLVGAVYDPVRGEMFSSRRGGGAYLNGEPVHPRTVCSLEQAVLSGGFFKAQSIQEGHGVFQKLTARVKKIRFLGAAALDLCYLACGRFNAYLQHLVNEWDVAAAGLVAEEAGALVEVLPRGERMDVLAADRNVFADLRAIVIPGQRAAL